MKRAARSLPLPGEVLTMISTGREGCQAVAANTDVVIARSNATKQARGTRSNNELTHEVVHRHRVELAGAVVKLEQTLLLPHREAARDAAFDALAQLR